jgi:hypothetical protein
MKKNILILAILIISASCSSSKKPAELARAYDPIIDRNDQVERVVAMIRENKKLDKNKKNDLIELVNAQAKKADEIKMKQSQLRAVLIDQLLESSDGSNSQTIATTKELEKIHKRNIKELNDFILKFKAISGEQDLRQDSFMREVGNVHLI